MGRRKRPSACFLAMESSTTLQVAPVPPKRLPPRCFRAGRAPRNRPPARVPRRYSRASSGSPAERPRVPRCVGRVPPWPPLPPVRQLPQPGRSAAGLQIRAGDRLRWDAGRRRPSCRDHPRPAPACGPGFLPSAIQAVIPALDHFLDKLEGRAAITVRPRPERTIAVSIQVLGRMPRHWSGRRLHVRAPDRARIHNRLWRARERA